MPAVGQPLHGVWQDNPAPPRDRIASAHPAPQQKDMRPRPSNTKRYRSQKRSTKRKTVSLTFWVKPSLKAELQHLSDAKNLSVSKIGSIFLEEAVRQKLSTQHAIFLEPIIEQAIRKEMHAFSNRLAFLLVRSCFTSEQTRIIVTNILNRQHGVTPQILNTILDNSSKTAKRNMTRRTPQVETILSQLDQAPEGETSGI